MLVIDATMNDWLQKTGLIPDPNSCTICGTSARFHGMSYTKTSGLHHYMMPNDALRLQRMKARRKFYTKR